MHEPYLKVGDIVTIRSDFNSNTALMAEGGSYVTTQAPSMAGKKVRIIRVERGGNVGGRQGEWIAYEVCKTSRRMYWVYSAFEETKHLPPTRENDI